jgi:hypothetical protein
MARNERIYTYKNVEGDVSVHIVAYGKRLYFFDLDDAYVLRVTHSDWNRGVFMDISLFNSGEDVRSYLKKCAVTSSENGITFAQPNGIALFVPRSTYGPRQ